MVSLFWKAEKTDLDNKFILFSFLCIMKKGVEVPLKLRSFLVMISQKPSGI